LSYARAGKVPVVKVGATVRVDLSRLHGVDDVALARLAQLAVRSSGSHGENIDLDTRRIHVRESTGGPLKDDDSRVVPILDALYPLLKRWRVQTGGVGQVVPTMRKGGKRCDAHTGASI
jgi:hypothetical protein